MGDLDGDGKEDLVVGSPYEDEGMGAVRVFYGKGDLTRLNGMCNIKIRNQGIKFYEYNMKNRFLGICAFFSTDDLQTISPKTIGNPSLRGFGISFSSHPHQDVDKNELEDLAIGIIKYIFDNRFSGLKNI